MVIEALVASEKGGTALLKQQGNNLFVLHATPPDVVAELAHADTPTLKKLALILR